MNRMAKKKHSALGRRLIASAKEMVAHVKGERELDEYELKVPPHTDVIAIRTRSDYLRRGSPAVSDSA
jgi:hypothetical protein